MADVAKIGKFTHQLRLPIREYYTASDIEPANPQAAADDPAWHDEDRHLTIRQRATTGIGHSRLRGTVIGLSAGAVLAVPLSQLATAPTARADNFTEIFDNVQTIISAGQQDLTTAASAFANADFADALGLSISGSNDLSLFPQEDILVGTIDALLGHSPSVFSNGLFPMDLDLATAMTDAQGVISDGQDEINEALTAFGNADLFDGLTKFVDGFNDLNVIAPDLLFIGSVDSLLGL